jgi:hypothetical protein
MPGVEEAWDEDDEPISLGGDAPDRDDRELGPDERDLDLMDGSWEQDYYSGGRRSIDWHAVTVGLALLVLLGLLVPVIEVFFR